MATYRYPDHLLPKTGLEVAVMGKGSSTRVCFQEYDRHLTKSLSILTGEEALKMLDDLMNDLVDRLAKRG